MSTDDICIDLWLGILGIRGFASNDAFAISYRVSHTVIEKKRFDLLKCSEAPVLECKSGKWLAVESGWQWKWQWKMQKWKVAGSACAHSKILGAAQSILALGAARGTPSSSQARGAVGRPDMVCPRALSAFVLGLLLQGLPPVRAFRP